MRSFRNHLVELPRVARRSLAVSTDAVLLALSLLVGAFLRFGDAGLSDRLYLVLAVLAAISGVTVFWIGGLYREVLRYAGPRLWLRLAATTAIVTLVVGTASLSFGEREISRSVLLAFFLTATMLCGGIRLIVGQWLAGIRPESGLSGEAVPVLVYGAGASGVGLAAAMAHSPMYRPVAFIDDDVRLSGSRVRDLPVYSPSKLPNLAERHPGAVVVLALPSASSADRRRVLERLRPLGLRIMTVPGLRELMLGRAGFGEIRDVNIEDLLGRDSVRPSEHLLAKCVTGKSVLVTGAGGSIGSELCRQIIRLRPSRLVLLDHSEFALYQIEQELAALARADAAIAKVPVHAVLGSVCGGVMVEELLRDNRVQTIYHAAAYKHVGIVEGNEVSGVAVNTFGTQTIARAAVKTKVETFVLVSTDKAVRPTNVMGASKRLAELVLQDLAAGGWAGVVGDRTAARTSTAASTLECPTRFVIVRFGNVLGSSGSVVPKFIKQIGEGGPVTVTHPEVTRFFMTISEAVNLVIQAGSLGHGGDVFLLDMGEPVRIADLARNLILLQGLTVRDESNVEGDIAIEFIGLQAGEKLYEELLVDDDAEETEHPKIRRAREQGVAGRPLAQYLTQLESACDRYDAMEIRRLLRELVEGVAERSSRETTGPGDRRV
jgi:FlaA1/EpsC-like NDP-sugar epimerase